MDIRLASQLAVALGVGLLIGAERERRKTAPGRGTAGIRTFGLVSLAGAVAFVLGGALGLAAVTIAVAGLAALGYVKSVSEDRGLTTETALVVATLLGALAVARTELAAAVGVVVTILLVVKEELHRFVRSVLSERELNDALLFAAVTLVVLPLVPSRAVDPLGVLVPRTVVEIAVLVMAVSAAGYIAQRALGARLGLPLAGIAGGLVSGIATIGVMGSRARKDESVERPAVAGAVLSNVSTVAQLSAILVVISPATVEALAVPLAGAGLIAVLYGAFFMLRGLEHPGKPGEVAGRAFDLRTAFGFAVGVTLVVLVAAELNAHYGARALAFGMGLLGFADTHSPAFSIASLVAGGRIAATASVIPMLAAFTTNTVTKAVVAYVTGGRRFALLLAPGLALMVVAAWLPLAFR